LAKPLPNSAADTGISEDILLIRKLCDKLDKADRQRLAALLDNM